MKIFEEVGWNHIDISLPAQQRIETTLQTAGAHIKSINLSGLTTSYQAFRHLREYESDYKTYAGTLEHCLLEKILEHYLSLLLIKPQPGMVGIDIGSCQSVLPDLAQRVYGVRYYKQDLEYTAGVHDNLIGSNAEAIPLPDSSVDFMTLHCTFEHFENNADTGFIKECARILKKGGTAVILPLYLNEVFCNLTGETDIGTRSQIHFDTKAEHYCLIPEWHNRFGRFYSPDAFMERIWRPSVALTLQPCLYKISHWDAIHSDLWLRWAFVIKR